MTSVAQRSAAPVPLARAIRRAASRVTWRAVLATFAIALALQAWSLYDSAFASTDSFNADAYVSSMIVNVTIAYSIMFTTFVADEFVMCGAPALAVYAFGILAGSVSGSLAQWLVHEGLRRASPALPGVAAAPGTYAVFVFFEYLIWGTIAVWIYVNRRGEMRARARMDASRLQRAETQRRSVEAQLTALQAQVEPRFLLDMLACARDRYEADATSGSAMLGALIAYLRTALPRLRECGSTLGRELELARAYLQVMREHLGDGLALEADVPDALCDARMPAMLMLPLIHHGVARPGPRSRTPAPIVASARVVDDRLRVRIVHDGRAFSFAADDSELTRIRQRLQALYADRATITIQNGSSAILEIPFEPGDRRHC